MMKFSWKTLGLAALVAGSAQLATMGGAAALTLPVPALPSVTEAGQFTYLQQAHYRSYRHYHRSRHGRRYQARRRGYRHFYGGYYYANPWWTIQVPIPAPHYGGGNAHVRYCLNKYRSYNPRTDMFLGYDGYYHRCRGPY